MTLAGPFSLDNVFDEVVHDSPGVYVLSRNALHPHYIGRSDSSIRTRIPQSAAAGSGYLVFWFGYAPSPKEAYQLECLLFHKYERHIDNSIHPAVPVGAYWRCPVVGCPWS